MHVTFQTVTENDRTFVIGYYSDLGGVELPSALFNERQWLDAYGNAKWELLANGSVVLANFVPTQAQIDGKALDERIDKASAILVKIIVQAIKGTAGPAASWQAIDAALRALLA